MDLKLMTKKHVSAHEGMNKGRGDTWDTTRTNSGRRSARDCLVSQKALGIVEACANYGTAYGAYVSHGLWVHLDITDEQILDAISYWISDEGYDLFIRSCPANPRPGVLESFRLNLGDGNNLAPIMELRDNLRLLDPEGCLVIQKWYPATHSVTLSTAGHITIGYGNDGVTAGNKGRTWSMAMNANHIGPNHAYATYLEYIEQSNSMRNKGDAEIEYVSQRCTPSEESPTGRSIRTHFVQYRAAETGPLMTEWAYLGEAVLENRTDDAFPALWPDDITQVTPKSCLVVHTLDDVAKLEALIEQGGWPKDFVVFAPTMSTASHAACTARAANIPYFKTQPNLNKTISLCGEKWNAKPHWGDFLSGVTIGYKHSSILKHEVGAYTHGEWLSIPFHQFITMPPNDAKETAICAGAFVGWILKAATAVAVGEVRHKYDKLNWNDRILLSTFTGVSEFDITNRQSYYHNIDKEVPNQQTLENILNWCLHIFEDYEWGSSYGGEAYAITVRKTLKVLKYLQTFQHHATKANFNKLITAVGGANGLENAVHNCGHFFNKFALKEAFDAGTAGLELTGIGSGHHALLLTAIEQVLDKEHGEVQRNVRFTQVYDALQNKKPPSVKDKPNWHTKIKPSDVMAKGTKVYSGKIISEPLQKKHDLNEVTLVPSPNPDKIPKTIIDTHYDLPWEFGQTISQGDMVKWAMPIETLMITKLHPAEIPVAIYHPHLTQNPAHEDTTYIEPQDKLYKVHAIAGQHDADSYTYVRTTCGLRLTLFGCKIIYPVKAKESPVHEWWSSLTPETQEAIPKSEWLVGHLEDV